MNIPNIITIFRIILIPIFLNIFHSGMENSVLYGGLIFILAGISDILDGQIARRFNLTTKLGAALDPFADKLMSFAVLISFTIAGFIPLFILIPMVIKELVMILGGFILYLRKDKRVIPANKYGKLATFSLYASITSIVIKFPVDIIRIFLIITLLLNLVAFYNYLKIFLGMKVKSNTVDKN